MNVLQLALNNIETLIQNQNVIISTYQKQNINGVITDTNLVQTNVYCHIQPITPNELKKITDSTIDSSECYKLFFLNDDAKVINSLDLKIKSSSIVWGSKELNVYGIRDWFIQNGWVCVYASLKNTLN